MKRSFSPTTRHIRLPHICAFCQSHCASLLTAQPSSWARTRSRRLPESPRRLFSSSVHAAKSNEIWNGTRTIDTSQAYPLSGYYYDVLNNPYPQQQQQQPPAIRTINEPNIPAKEPTKEEKMSIVFGTRLAGPGYQSSRYNPETMPPESTWRTINGVPIPPRPSEPDNCCMSGCVHCVWDDYRDDLETWASRIKEAKAKAQSGAAADRARLTDMRQRPRQEVASASASMDDDGGGSERNWELPAETTAGEEDELFSGIPVGIREFMKTEKKLRQKKQQESIGAD
ncbi:oxidoreductase-like protein [Talaromyces proteolyticus]|uniref:Oxidoreductase-like protein n=1 Tax=Talaromyces proteolyticus TaxID=1131652 RepID=A0AAD4PTL1_9EURO|nr:oxidoreductase-like protein [Talaromyces proteolyticus]KAH8690951.1 oxidoreductase-like protein [Talaromyces proteolyticus]